MKHRRVLAPLMMVLATSVAGPATISEAGQDRTVQAKGITFTWHHKDGRLHGLVTADTEGWIAVGFNTDRRLKGTRFVIGRVTGTTAEAEVHIALVPDHAEVGSLGGTAGLRDLAGGRRSRGRTWLAFSLPYRTGDAFDVPLAPGSTVHLMLAWSQSKDFDHHSRVRVHRDTTL